MANWKEYRLGEIAEIVMGQSPSGETCNELGVGVPLLNGPTEFGSSFPQPVQFTTDPKRFAKPLDILFCVRGSTTGKMNWADKDYAIGRGLAAIRHKEGERYRHFIKGLIDINLNLLLQSATGSTFPNVSKDQLNNLSIVAPDLGTQECIAEILSSLDDKIELNNQINKNLEALAQALFKQWFVDFEFPNENGQPYKSSGGEMVESELGEIPKGWRVGKVFELLELQRGHDLPTDSRLLGTVPVYSASGLHGYHNEVKVKAPGVITGRSGVIGNVFIILEDYWPLNTTLFVKQFKIATPEYSYFFLQRLDLHSLNAGSAVPTLNRNDVHNLNCVVPYKDTILRFTQAIGVHFELIEHDKKENNQLKALRNSLLTKLISGELEVSESLIEATT